jgi:hypothetical protein
MCETKLRPGASGKQQRKKKRGLHQSLTIGARIDQKACMGGLVVLETKGVGDETTKGGRKRASEETTTTTNMQSDGMAWECFETRGIEVLGSFSVACAVRVSVSS